jgi:hypothetical protein
VGGVSVVVAAALVCAVMIGLAPSQPRRVAAVQPGRHHALTAEVQQAVPRPAAPAVEAARLAPEPRVERALPVHRTAYAMNPPLTIEELEAFALPRLETQADRDSRNPRPCPRCHLPGWEHIRNREHLRCPTGRCNGCGQSRAAHRRVVHLEGGRLVQDMKCPWGAEEKPPVGQLAASTRPCERVLTGGLRKGELCGRPTWDHYRLGEWLLCPDDACRFCGDPPAGHDRVADGSGGERLLCPLR